MAPLRIVFCGTPDFAVPSLQALAKDDRFIVEQVITQPDKPVGRKQIVMPTPIKAAAQALGIPVLQPENINNVARMEPAPDFLVVVAYGQLLKQPLLDLPTIAPVNLHASLLPRWRGASPMQHALLHNDHKTGVTLQRMVKALDAGPILGKREYDILPRETAETLHNELSHLGAGLLIDTLTKPLQETPQEESQVTVCHKLSRKDGVVDAKTMTAQEIDRKVRALYPWPGVSGEILGRNVKIIETDLDPTENAYALPCAEGTTLYLVHIQEPGKRVLTGLEWSRGLKA